jgi:hypothetical protein
MAQIVNVRFTPKADIGTQSRDVRFVPIADIEREEIRSGNFNDRAGRPRDNAPAFAADIRPPLNLRPYTIPEPFLVPAGGCEVDRFCKGLLGGTRR